MFREYDAQMHIYGYGNTEEEAISELAFNKLKRDITVDKDWVERRKLLHSWCPTPNSIYFTGVTSVIYNNGTLTNTNTGKSVVVKDEPLSQFISLYYVLNREVSFADFCITYSKTIDEFFKGIAPNSWSMKDFPDFKPGELSSDITILHKIDNRAFVGESTNHNVLVCSNYKDLIEVDVPIGVPVKNMVAYGLAKLGYLYNGEVLV